MLHETCMLVSLQIGMPPQSRLAKQASVETEIKYKTAHKQARVTKDLFSKQDIKPLQKVMTQARNLFNELSLPYDVGYRIIPSASYFEFVEKMAPLSIEFDSKKTRFIKDYHITMMRSELELGELFRETDYPSTEHLEHRMHLSIESTVLPPVTAFDNLVGLDEETIEELKAQAVAGQQKKVDEALHDLFDRLRKSLNKATIKLATTDAIFRDTLVSNINAALEAVETLNLTNDERLIELSDEVRGVIEGITPDDLRNDEELRKQTAEETKNLVTKLDEFF